MPYAAAIAAIIGAGTAVAGGVKQEQARQSADNAAGRQADKQAEAEKVAKAKLADEEAKTAANAMRDAAKQSRKAGATGRAGTILTSPLGAPSGTVPGKTLLGM